MGLGGGGGELPLFVRTGCMLENGHLNHMPLVILCPDRSITFSTNYLNKPFSI